MRSSRFLVRQALVPVLLLLLSALPAGAQQANGRIVGQVVDAQTGRPLPGAQLMVEGTQMGSIAGLEGRFVLANVPAGTVSVRALMIGYATKTISGVEVPAAGVAQLNLTLESSAVELAGITVSVEQERGSVVAALNEQRSAVGVVNSIGAERMARSPDGDAADAVKRVSGVSVQEGKYVFVRGLGERYTTSSLNGARIPSPEPERKVVPLDLFPTGLIQSISTSKTFTPDQPGDFSGGSVNIRTREFPARRQVNLSLSSGFHPDITGRSVLAAPTEAGEWMARATGPRAIPGPALDFGTEARRGPEANRIINSFRNRWSVQQRQGDFPLSAGISVGGSDPILGQNFGYLGSLTYNRSAEGSFDQVRARALAADLESDRYEGESGRTSVLVGGLLNVSTTLGNHSRISLNNNYNRSADSEARMEEGVDENTASAVRVERLRYVERVVRSNQLQAEHQLSPSHRLDWSMTNSGVTRDEPDRSEFVTWLDPAVPVWFNDFEGAVRSFGELREDGLEVSANYRWTLGTGLRSHELRMGGNYRQTDREATSLGYRIQSFFWSPTDERWQQSPEVFFDGRNAGPEDANFLLSRELAGGGYDANDQLVAGYLMGDIALGDRIRVIGGARLEQYNLEVNSENNLGQRNQSLQEYTDVLPSLAVNVDLSERQKLRLSVARTLARPEYRELAPIAYREVLGGEQVIGNQDLERTLIDNFDIRWEFYPTLTDVISVGLFAKNFDGPIEQRYLGRSGTDTRSYENAVSASNLGLELELVQGLGLLSRALEPISLFSNLTLMRSEVDTGNPDDDQRTMVGQAPWVVNSGLTYANSTQRYSATVLFNSVGERIVSARPSGRGVPDAVERPRPTLDFSLRFPLLNGAAGKLDLKNLLDSPYELRQGAVIREYYRSGRSVSFGLSWQP